MSHVNALLGVSSGGWTPAQLPSLAAWWDASDASTITLSGSTVTGLADKSGQARHMTLSLGAPTVATGPNGLNVLQFDGASALRTPAWGLPTTAFGLFGVASSPLSSNRRVWQSLGSNSHVALTHAENGTGVYTEGVLFGGVAWWRVSGGSALAGAWARQTLTRSAGVSTYRRGSVTGTNGATPTAQSGHAWLGGDGAGSVPCLVGEVIVTSITPSTADREACEAYLAQKWGTP